MVKLSTILAKLRSTLRFEGRLNSGRSASSSRLFSGTQFAAACLGAAMLLVGCTTAKTAKDLQWADGEKPMRYYKGQNTAIEHPAIDNETAKAVQETLEPRSLHAVLKRKFARLPFKT